MSPSAMLATSSNLAVTVMVVTDSLFYEKRRSHLCVLYYKMKEYCSFECHGHLGSLELSSNSLCDSLERCLQSMLW